MGRGTRALAGALVLSLGCGGDEALGSSESSDATGETTSGSTGTSTTTADVTTTDADATSSSSSTSTGEAVDESSSGGGSVDEPGPFEKCYEGVFVNAFPGPNYDDLGITVGSHCLGTNHQTIENVERVVFLGDSVTVGTPPTLMGDYYRSRLADALADRFGLEFGANKALWQTPNRFSGQSIDLHSGDFSSCAEWGARNDDLLAGDQFAQCFPEDKRDLVTLTIITSGGNDLAAMGRAAGEGASFTELFAMAQEAVDHKRQSLEWLADPENFPNGNYVVFGNIYEFTDATAEVQSCDLSGLAGFDNPIPVPLDALLAVAWMEIEYAKIALETNTDFIFMFEEFCGHGFEADNPESPCYRGPGTERWFDLTCIHPTPTGHGVLADMFFAVISE